MAEIKREALFGKLNSLLFKSMETAAGFAQMRGNRFVELVHWVHTLLQIPNTDVQRLIAHYKIDEGRLQRDIVAALDRLPRGAGSLSGISSDFDDAIQQAWLYATLLMGDSGIRSGHMIVGILKKRDLANTFLALSGEFGKIKPEDLTDNFARILSGSQEDSTGASDGSSLTGKGDGPAAAPGSGKQDALNKFTVDLTEQARKGDMDPIVGRDDEIRQIVDILMRRRQNNPILTGEAGVGKTAVVEGFAQRVAAGDIPPAFKDVAVRSLDLGLLQAGASMKGEFEQRLKSVIEEVQASPKPIILFIDEAHTLIGAGGAAGQNDAANLLKPALARGTLRTIAATTWAEYKKYFEKDPALTRRFQVIKVDEPSEAKATQMMRRLASSLEKHHRVQLLDEALEASVKLSHRYIPARQLPDKAVSLLDTACARVAISQHATPPQVEDCQRTIQALETEQEILARESAVGLDHAARKGEIDEQLAATRARLAELEGHWKQERELVNKILAIRERLRSDAKGTIESRPGPERKPGAEEQVKPLSDSERSDLLSTLKTHQEDLAKLQGEDPLVLPSVDQNAVASVVADWTGIPVGRMVKDEIQAVLALADTLNKRIIGQRHALEAIAKRIRTARAGLDNPSKPIGVFMLAGPSGVGKTETALALAESLYGGEQNVITINMSEFQEAHTVSTLKGAPPGYVGYGEGGVLTEAVRRKPYSVVLLDEVEKAHTDVHEIFFQVFDKGRMEDGEGREIDFHNTIILLTTNVGSDLIMNMCKDPDLIPEPEAIAKALREPLLKVFPAALLGRIVVIPYHPLSDSMLANIIELQLGRIAKRLRQSHKIPFTYDPSVVKLVAGRCTELESGGRMVDAILTNTLLPEMSAEILNRMIDGRGVSRVHVETADSAFRYSFD